MVRGQPRKLTLAGVVGAIAIACLIGGGGAALALGDEASQAEETTAAERAETPETPEADLPAGVSGRVVHVDPTSGRPTGRPSAAQRAGLQSQLQALANRSTAGLFETAGARGGVMVNLQGRFRQGLGLAVGEDGRLIEECTALVAEEVDDE